MNPNIQHKNVNKRFFNKYYYKLEMSVIGAAFLRYPETPLQDQIESRRLMRSVNHGGSWRSMRYKEPSFEDVLLLELLRETMPTYSKLKFRIEDPTLHAYSDDLAMLYDFAWQTTGTNRSDHLRIIWAPDSNERLQLIQQGYTISKKTLEHPYKVHVREGRYSKDTKSQLMAYLQSMPEDVRLPKHFLDIMSRKYESVWNCYFYVKDPKVLTMLALISPTLVRSIEEYHVPEADK